MVSFIKNNILSNGMQVTQALFLIKMQPFYGTHGILYVPAVSGLYIVFAVEFYAHAEFL